MPEIAFPASNLLKFHTNRCAAAQCFSIGSVGCRWCGARGRVHGSCLVVSCLSWLLYGVCMQSEIRYMACRDGSFSRAILFSSRGDMEPDMDVNYLYVWVGYLACALDLPIRLS